MRKTAEISLSEKYILTIQEAAAYTGIGEKTLRKFISEHMKEKFIMTVGTQVRIKRQLFEKYIDNNLFAI